MEAWWFIALAIAVIAAGAGILFRAGRVGPERPWYRKYRDEQAPGLVRNLPFGVLPFGVAFLLLVIAVPMFDVSSTAGAALVIAAFVLGAIGTWASHRAPGWAKPRWLRDEERRG